ncbi:hypothetical protein NG99_04520 [Erwinia typographi]|uniref:Uncharacterized protein n=1 Tax=Erwinia typographi TaxID=371042 RepID=A0A0A4ABU0_9GAMM|nr:hypothetical protein [Erwinia typographi]KGT95288.1 hypothetical protein NG99_04520 [Erwinia typographi]
MGDLLSGELQWEIIDVLEDVYPRHLSTEEYDHHFGEKSENEMVVNLLQLIEDGIINPQAVMRRLMWPKVNIPALLLTPFGYKLARAED